jgi:hypothetical protein
MQRRVAGIDDDPCRLRVHGAKQAGERHKPGERPGNTRSGKTRPGKTRRGQNGFAQ